MSGRAFFEMQEWECMDLPEVLSDLDYLCLSQLSEQNKIQLLPGKRRNTYRLRALSWVGSVQLNHFDLMIRPKIALDRVYGMLARVNGELTRVPWRGLYDEVQSLPELIARLFSEKLLKLAQQEVHQEYLRTQQNSSVLRGRFLIQQDLRKNWPARNRVYCEYSVRSPETPANRVIALAREQILHSCLVNAQETREKLIESKGFWPQISLSSEWDLDLDLAKASRLSPLYREVLGLAEVFLKGLSFELGRKDGSQGFLVDMNRLFEDFVRVILCEHLSQSEFQVSQKGQLKAHLCRDGEGRGVYLEIPDIGIFKSGKLVYLLDAKYKNYDGVNPSKEDIRQLSLYLLSFGESGVKRADLVYPGKQKREPFFLGPGLEIGMLPLDLGGSWEELMIQSAAWAAEVKKVIQLLPSD